MLGWLISHQFLSQIHGNLKPMSFVSAFGFVLTGLTALFITYSKLLFGYISGSLLLILGAVSFARFGFDLDLLFDNKLTKLLVPVETTHPVRISPAIAFCFVLAGMWSVVYQFTKSRYTTLNFLNSVNVLIFILALTALFGNLSNLEPEDGWTLLTCMPLHTSISFLIVSATFFFVTLPQGFSLMKIHAGRLAIFSGTLMALFLLTIWQSERQKEVRLINKTLVEETNFLETHLQNSVTSRLTALQRMAQRWTARNGTPFVEWQLDAKHYVYDQPGLQAVEWVDKEYFVRWIEPIKGNEAAVNLNLMFEGSRKEMLLKSKELDQIVISEPIQLVQTGKGFLASSPVYVHNKFDGYILGVFNIPNLMEDLLPEEIILDYNVMVKISGDVMYQSGDANFGESEWSYRRVINVSGQEWTIYIWPRSQLVNVYLSGTSAFSFLGIIASTLLMALAIYFAMVSIKRGYALGESIAKQRAIFEQAAEGILILDDNGLIEEANPSVEKILREKSSFLIGKPLHRFIPISHLNTSADLEILANNSIEPEISSTTQTFDICVDEKHTISIEFSLNVVVVFQEKRFCAFIRDVSERTKVQKEREAFVQELARSNAALDEFCYIASHDLKEPVRAINNHSKILLLDNAKNLDESAVKRLNRLQFLTNRINKLISDLLYYSRLGKTENAIQMVDLNEIMTDIKLTMADTANAQNATILVNGTLPQIWCDKVRVTELFRNLVENAIKYNDESQKVVEVGFSEKQQALFVKDNGIGVDAEFHQEIFKIFKRLHRESSYGGGSGSGLTFVKKIVEQHMGNIWLESDSGNGSTFYFTLNLEQKNDIAN